MEANELRSKFRRYMGNEGYHEIPSDSLISDTFPTCFTISGGPNFVDRYLKKSKSATRKFSCHSKMPSVLGC